MRLTKPRKRWSIAIFLSFSDFFPADAIIMALCGIRALSGACWKKRGPISQAYRLHHHSALAGACDPESILSDMRGPGLKTLILGQMADQW